MIFETPEGYRVRLWEPGKPPMEWGEYPTWHVAFAAEQRIHEQLRQERERPRHPRSEPPAPTLWDALDGGGDAAVGQATPPTGRSGALSAPTGILAGPGENGAAL